MMRPEQHLIDPDQPYAVFAKAGSAPQGPVYHGCCNPTFNQHLPLFESRDLLGLLKANG